MRRNLARFPADFMFRLTDRELAILRQCSTLKKLVDQEVANNADCQLPFEKQEVAILKSQIATSSWGGRRKLPLAFTEHGAIMAATILNSPRAVEVSVYVVRAFVRLRELLASNKELAKRLDELETRVMQKLETHDQAITGILKTIRELMNSPKPPPPVPRKRRPIGFTANLNDEVSED